MITKKTNKILWLMAIAMITIFIAFACSEKPTESANLSSSGVGGTTITPPTGGGTSSQPALKITDWVAIQFDGLTFKNENHTVNIVVKKLGGNMSEARFVLNGKTYGFGGRIYNSQYNPNTFIFGNINNDISDKGYAEFRESGDLLIWFNNNQSDLITLKLANNTDGEKPETDNEISSGNGSDKDETKNYLIPQEYLGKYKCNLYPDVAYIIVSSNKVYDYNASVLLGMCFYGESYDYWESEKPLNIISVTNIHKNDSIMYKDSKTELFNETVIRIETTGHYIEIYYTYNGREMIFCRKPDAYWPLTLTHENDW